MKRDLIYHNLAVLMEAGLPVKKAFATVGSGLRGRFAKDLEALNAAISRGSSIAEAMAARPRSFSRMDVMIVQAGETSGMVAQAMHRLAEWYGFSGKLRRQFIVGLIYPIFLVHAAAFLLPLPALFLLDLRFGPYVLTTGGSLTVVYVLMGVIWAVWHLTPPTGLVRRMLDGLVLEVPLLSRALVHLALGRFTRVFHTLYTAGVPIQRALSQSIEVCGNAVVAGWLQGATRSVRAGNAASEGFSHRVPRDFVAAWANGEVSGQLDVISDRLAEMEADAAQFQLSLLAWWVPRIIYILIVLCIGAMIVLTLRTLVIPRLFEF